MKVLVTGASGFLGSHIAEQLGAQGHQVRVLVRRTSNRRFLAGFPHEEAVGDVTEPASLAAAVAAVEAVVHAAGLVKARSVGEFEAVNARGTANLLAAVADAAPHLRRFVYISSLAAHGPSPDGRPRPTDAPPNPITTYGRTKLAGEEMVRRSAIFDRSVILRMPVTYGPRDPGLFPFFRLARFRIAPLLTGGQNRLSIIYVEDAARAAVQAATAAADSGGKTFCPEDGNVYSWRDLSSAIAQAVGRRALPVPLPRWLFTAAAAASETFGFFAGRAAILTREKVREMAQPYWVCSAEPLKRELGWTPRVAFWEGARLTADWYRRHRWI